ncbi:MAG: TM2 domain-containing protein [Bacteroidales bacterium]
MKKILTILLIVSIAVINFQQSNASSKYKLDEERIDALFKTTAEADLNLLSGNVMNRPDFQTMAMSEKDPMVAILLDFFLGGLGVHRFYLGTKPITGIGYILTCGGIFGVVPLIDLIMLAIDYDDISKYVDNPKFFMWA